MNIELNLVLVGEKGMDPVAIEKTLCSGLVADNMNEQTNTKVNGNFRCRRSEASAKIDQSTMNSGIFVGAKRNEMRKQQKTAETKASRPKNV